MGLVNRKQRGTLAATVFSLALLGLAGCGSKPAVAPPPAPAPAGPVGGMGYSGNCGAVGGIPLHQDGSPYVGDLYGQYTGATTDTITLNLSYQSYGNADSGQKAIVGGGSFTMNEISSIVPGWQSQQSPTFCISTTSPQGGAMVPGYVISGYSYLVLNVAMKGMLQVPLNNPFNQYPGSYGGQVSYQPTQVDVSIGKMSPAYLQNGRVIGMISVTMGQLFNSPLYYQAQ